ncbi:hypothetical protein QBC42DRAFT_321541 [Cladorrhinum samala]|uniref:Uncharacterized protein n=1 Tax=Cladorrhinum samala TaxID=585594 RepID=A0AAV9H9Z0_9PEZI|nr:hypothetical protein QBC42DRAFT_321541 [Cladorrhinum samala]
MLANGPEGRPDSSPWKQNTERARAARALRTFNLRPGPIQNNYSWAFPTLWGLDHAWHALVRGPRWDHGGSAWQGIVVMETLQEASKVIMVWQGTYLHVWENTEERISIPWGSRRPTTASRRDGGNAKMAYEWHGNAGNTIIIIALVLCFGWVPIVVAVSVFGKIKARWFNPEKNVELHLAGKHQKQPVLATPNPIYHSTAGTLERRGSVKTLDSSEFGFDLKRWDTQSSWDPIRPFEYNDTESIHRGRVARPNSIRSNYTARSRITAAPIPAMPSRASSIRSVASQRSHHEPPQRQLAPAPPLPQQSRSRRGSVSTNYDGPPAAFQINDTYYDTTPLPPTPKLPLHIRDPSSSRLTFRSSGSGSGSAFGSGSKGTLREKPSDVSGDGEHRESPRSAIRAHRHQAGIAEPSLARLPAPRRGSLHAQTFEPPELDWMNQPHAM